MTSQQQLETMLTMQDRINRRIDPDWVNRGFEWYRALWVECGELVDHYGYKWWKHQSTDMDQVRLEIVDIWHFGMSMLFDGRSIEQIASAVDTDLRREQHDMVDVLDSVEALAGAALSEHRFCLDSFSALMQAAGLTFDALYVHYIGKNVLNFFRQDHGYRDGAYRKQWQGREDNEHLAEIVRPLDSGSDDFAGQLYRQLTERYAASTGAVAPD